MFYVQHLPPPPENRIVYEIMWKNAVEPERPQMTTEHAPVHAGEARLHTRTHICNIY
jgi:hypothetical protein